LQVVELILKDLLVFDEQEMLGCDSLLSAKALLFILNDLNSSQGGGPGSTIPTCSCSLISHQHGSKHIASIHKPISIQLHWKSGSSKAISNASSSCVLHKSQEMYLCRTLGMSFFYISANNNIGVQATDWVSK